MVGSVFRFVKTVGILLAVSAAGASASEIAVKGRHGSYRVKQIASATVQIQAFGWRDAFALTAFAETPKSHQGSIDRVLQILSGDKLPYVRLQIDDGIRAYAQYSRLADALQRSRGRLSSPKGEVDRLIEAVERKGSEQMDVITAYYEKSSGTFVVNLDGDETSIDSSDEYFAKLLGMFNDSRAKFRIIDLR